MPTTQIATYQNVPTDLLDFFDGHFGTWNLEGDVFSPIVYGVREGIIRRILREAGDLDAYRARHLAS